MVQPRWIADDLFLTGQMGIYLNMEIDKKNALSAAEKPLVKKNYTRDAVVNGSVASGSTDDYQQEKLVEINGPKGLEPTRYGDWEQKGRCTDF